MAQKFHIQGIPVLAIDGRYVAHPEASADEEQSLKDFLTNTDQLIERVRSERGPQKASSKGKGAEPGGGGRCALIWRHLEQLATFRDTLTAREVDGFHGAGVRG